MHCAEVVCVSFRRVLNLKQKKLRDSTHNISLLTVIKGFSSFSSPCGSQYLFCQVIGSPFFMSQQLKGSISLSHTQNLWYNDCSGLWLLLL